MNYYKQVAEMLGVELNEEFSLKNEDDETLTNKYKITECSGLLFKCNDEWLKSGYIDKIICGDLTIVKLPLKPSHMQKYYVYSIYHKKALEINWMGLTEDFLYWNIGNCFRTREEAETKGKEIMEKIEKEYEEA